MHKFAKHSQVCKSMHKYAKACTSMQMHAQEHISTKVCKSRLGLATLTAKIWWQLFENFMMSFSHLFQILWWLLENFMMSFSHLFQILCQHFPALFDNIRRFRMNFYFCFCFVFMQYKFCLAQYRTLLLFLGGCKCHS
jgi:hypothetical protein